MRSIITTTNVIRSRQGLIRDYTVFALWTYKLPKARSPSCLHYAIVAVHGLLHENTYLNLVMLPGRLYFFLSAYCSLSHVLPAHPKAHHSRQDSETDKKVEDVPQAFRVRHQHTI